MKDKSRQKRLNLMQPSHGKNIDDGDGDFMSASGESVSTPV